MVPETYLANVILTKISEIEEAIKKAEIERAWALRLEDYSAVKKTKKLLKDLKFTLKETQKSYKDIVILERDSRIAMQKIKSYQQVHLLC